MTRFLLHRSPRCPRPRQQRGYRGGFASAKRRRREMRGTGEWGVGIWRRSSSSSCDRKPLNFSLLLATAPLRTVVGGDRQGLETGRGLELAMNLYSLRRLEGHFDAEEKRRRHRSRLVSRGETRCGDRAQSSNLSSTASPPTAETQTDLRDRRSWIRAELPPAARQRHRHCPGCVGTSAGNKLPPLLGLDVAEVLPSPSSASTRTDLLSSSTTSDQLYHSTPHSTRALAPSVPIPCPAESRTANG
ncbi:MAG: hypothetical protein RL095_1771 [Verrucomicrobiota bacterium]|jgi:hypothetical protein